MLDQNNVIATALIFIGLMALPVALIYGIFCIFEGESPKAAFISIILAICLAGGGYYMLPNTPAGLVDSDAIIKAREAALIQTTEHSFHATYVMDIAGHKLHGVNCSELSALEEDQILYTDRSFDELAAEGYFKCEVCKGGE